MNRLWEEKGEGVDVGAAWVKVFPHQMVYGGQRAPGPKRAGHCSICIDTRVRLAGHCSICVDFLDKTY